MPDAADRPSPVSVDGLSGADGQTCLKKMLPSVSGAFITRANLSLVISLSTSRMSKLRAGQQLLCPARLIVALGLGLD